MVFDVQECSWQIMRNFYDKNAIAGGMKSIGFDVILTIGYIHINFLGLTYHFDSRKEDLKYLIFKKNWNLHFKVFAF